MSPNVSVNHQVDVLELARAALNDRRRLEAITRVELIALLGFVLRVNHEEPRTLDAGLEAMAPALPASLAATVARAISASDALDLARRRQVADRRGEFGIAEAVVAFNAAFAALKTRFEEEFPHANV